MKKNRFNYYNKSNNGNNVYKWKYNPISLFLYAGILLSGCNDLADGVETQPCGDLGTPLVGFITTDIHNPEKGNIDPALLENNRCPSKFNGLPFQACVDYTEKNSTEKKKACSVCPEGEIYCDYKCTDGLNDIKNCGSCGHSCDDNKTCANGECVECDPSIQEYKCFTNENYIIV